MEVVLNKRPKNPIIIEGFPGFGLVGTIACEFLMDHLHTEAIGKIWLREMPAMVAVHKGQIVEPIGIFYNKKYNIVFIHAVTGVNGLEWKITEALLEVAHKLKAKEVISLEGIGSTTPSAETKAFFYATKKVQAKKFKSAGAEELQEGIIMGTTGLLLLKGDSLPISCVFGEAHSELPDAKAAAKVIEIIDNYLGLKIDPKPLLKQAEKFEKKLKTLLVKSEQAVGGMEKKKLSYVG